VIIFNDDKRRTVSHIYELAVILKDGTTDKRTNSKMTDKTPTLRQNQKSCHLPHKANALQHICFCPNRTATVKTYKDLPTND